MIVFETERELLFHMLGCNNRLSGSGFNVRFEGSTAIINDYAKLYDAINNSGVYDVFVKNSYQFLPAKGKVVIDIGANVADSCIYFVLRGASKVVGLEPFPKNYERARIHITDNNMDDTITLLMAGVGTQSSSFTIDAKQDSNTMSQLNASSTGITVPLFSLQDLTEKYGGDILKIDCEGCEYDAILNADTETLRKFSHIQIEFHFGYRNLKQKLRQAGFHISMSDLGYYSRKKMLTGYLRATRY